MRIVRGVLLLRGVWGSEEGGVKGERGEGGGLDGKNGVRMDGSVLAILVFFCRGI